MFTIQVEQYFHESMNESRFEIVKIERYQNQLKFDSYYQNLRNVQYKMGHSDLKSVRNTRTFK